MRKVKILTDSTCDLNEEILAKYDIALIPLYVTIDGQTYHDFTEMKARAMYDLSEKTGSHPKTAACSIQDFRDFFMEYLTQDYDIIYCGIGANLSSCYQNVHLVKNLIVEKHPEYESQMYFVDSGNLSTGISLVLLKMCEARDKGMSAEEIVKVGENTVPRVRAQFCVENLDYIYKGGRCSNASRFIGNMLHIKPYLKVRDGKLNVAKKSIGSFKKALNLMIDEFKECFQDVDKEFVFITHSEGDAFAKYIREKISDVTPQIENLMETKAGCVISSHCGEHTIGILYIMKEN